MAREHQDALDASIADLQDSIRNKRPRDPKYQAEVDRIQSHMAARNRYTGTNYTDMNGALRGTRDLKGKRRETALTNVDGLDAAFAEYGVSNAQEITVHRGVRADHPALPGLRRPGGTYTDDGYTSTTTSRTVADNFRRKGRGGRGTGPRVDIIVPPGGTLLSGNGAEDELILPRGSTFRSRGEQPDGTIVLEVVL